MISSHAFLRLHPPVSGSHWLRPDSLSLNETGSATRMKASVSSAHMSPT